MNDPAELRAKAEKCRQLAKGSDDLTRANLLMLAEAYEAEAIKLEPPHPASQADVLLHSWRSMSAMGR